MGGTILASSISGSLDAKNIVLGVLKKQIELSNLLELATQVQVPELVATITIQSVPEAAEDLGEWEMEAEGIAGSDFTNVDFLLKKDRVKLAVSDESKYKSRAGDPMALQIDAAGMRLAQKIDKKIVAALQTSPQTGATGAIWSTVTNNPLRDFAKAVAAIRPYRADYAIMPSNVWAGFVGNDYTGKYATGSTSEMGKAITTIPGLNLRVYVNDNVTAKSCIVGCSGAPSVAFGVGPVEVFRRKVEGGEIYTLDTWRQAKAPILKNASSLNMGAYVLTGVIA